jgi:hypothetical protein
MQDFYFEKTRASVDDDWPESFNGVDLAQVLNVERVSYRIYYSKDNLTCRLFVFRPGCTPAEKQTLLGLGFVYAQDGDTENIPDKPVEVTVTYLGKEYSYPLLAAKELVDDRVRNLANYEYWVQGYVFCYNETRRFHFLTTKEEFAKHSAKQEERLTKFLRNKGI